VACRIIDIISRCSRQYIAKLEMREESTVGGIVPAEAKVVV
jgi:hypothetical protein